ncbi:excinuclease ABC subunit UvrB [Aminobacterium colombiense]|uniref:UvrABC system protein B n=1 Tax=Aminobacterium colombiense (strain DSM 12261 / ALA-1) TaxID=572547 RepID=D5EED1_AMICL|nr:excinuclease ABC subunit UvrB [Aminobacterium colombiense]ADE56913.1 excinuclease ABC, B subunit [Aminobacterium colombiense DSM 12261]
MSGIFNLKADWGPSGDQPEAIEKLVESLKNGTRFQTLLGVTGSGKTFTVANVLAQFDRPVLVLAHNKTLAAQLYTEFKTFFPHNAVHYFVSYYDYYQPEAYIPSSDTYIEKDASINDRIEKLRLAATKALVERRDVIVVASVSCIYGLGKKEMYEEVIFPFAVGEKWDRRGFMERLIDNYYARNDMLLEAGKFRARGDVLEIYPSYSETALRVAFFDDEIERIDEIDPVSGHTLKQLPKASIFPAQHYVTSRDAIDKAMGQIQQELDEQLHLLKKQGKLLEAQRLEMRTRYDMEMLAEVGYCSGIENYSRYLDGRNPGEPPGTLLDFFPDDFIMVIDESHITLPQVRGMYNGDRARKTTLVENGFRLPSCLDNRPLNWREFKKYLRQVIFISATPGDWEREVSTCVAEQIIRPTGVVDPEVVVSPATGQVDDLVDRLRGITARGERALVTTLTKKSSEDLAEYLADLQFKVKYIHSELNAFERAELIRDLRSGEVSILVGINLLREGMDLPEVSLVAILDADREGFLRSHRSLIQIMGRAARNTRGQVVLYADVETESIRTSVQETRRRREIQMLFNEKHGIIPQTISKTVQNLLPEEFTSDAVKLESRRGKRTKEVQEYTHSDLERLMWEAVEKLDFEKAAQIRDILTDSKGKEWQRVASYQHKRSKRAQSQKYKRNTSKK